MQAYRQHMITVICCVDKCIFKTFTSPGKSLQVQSQTFQFLSFYHEGTINPEVWEDYYLNIILILLAVFIKKGLMKLGV